MFAKMSRKNMEKRTTQSNWLPQRSGLPEGRAINQNQNVCTRRNPTRNTLTKNTEVVAEVVVVVSDSSASPRRTAQHGAARTRPPCCDGSGPNVRRVSFATPQPAHLTRSRSSNAVNFGAKFGLCNGTSLSPSKPAGRKERLRRATKLSCSGAEPRNPSAMVVPAHK
jgi:hypothetical protein